MGKDVIIILTTYKPHVAEVAKEMIAFFQRKGIHADIYEYDGVTPADPAEKQYDFAVSLGGDGTVLFTARYCAPKKIPVLPINLGEFGFIAGIEPEYWELINLAVSFNGVSFGTYRADGVIVSSPTGSTAYSAASGGPIMDPTVAAFVLTPISAFSLSNRPVVLPASGVMHIDVLHNRQKDVIVSIDGQESFPLCEGDRIEIRMSPHRLTLVGCSPEAFYTALRSKLAWSGSPLQD